MVVRYYTYWKQHIPSPRAVSFVPFIWFLFCYSVTSVAISRPVTLGPYLYLQACNLGPMNLVPCFCFLCSIYYDFYSVILLVLLLFRACNSGPETLWHWAHHGPVTLLQVLLPLGVYISDSFIPFIWFLFCYSVMSVGVLGPWFQANGAMTPWHQAHHRPRIPHQDPLSVGGYVDRCLFCPCIII